MSLKTINIIDYGREYIMDKNTWTRKRRICFNELPKCQQPNEASASAVD